MKHTWHRYNLITTLTLLVCLSLTSINTSNAETGVKMQLSKPSKQAHQFLINWEKKKSILDLNKLLNMQILTKTERVEFEEYFSFILRQFFKDQFYAFAVDGAGGYYAFWITPDGSNEYPLVFIDSEGEHEYLAPSLWHYIRNIPKELTVSSDLHEYLDDMIDDYQEEHGKELSKEEMKTKLLETLKQFQTDSEKLEKSSPSDITKKDFKKLLKKLDQEEERLLAVHAKFVKDKLKALNEKDEQAFAITFTENIDDAYSYMQRNRDEHVTMYWYSSVYDNLKKIRILSEKGYNQFLPDNNKFKTWKTYMVPKLENKLLKLSNSERTQGITVKQLTEMYDYFINR